MQNIQDSQVSLLWHHFEKLSAIPRVSQNERAAADYVAAFAQSRGLAVERDEAGNVLVRKPASAGCEKAPAVILQSHLDMVGQKTDASKHDFAKDPLTLVRDGDWLRASGTTLGADNGMGVSASLAVLESTTIQHGPLAALFTVEEEIGLRGAAKVSPAWLQGSYLINLDADSPEELTIGCAGAMDLRVEFAPVRKEFPRGWKGLRFSARGLRGGHSGADIHLNRGNAIRIAGRILSSLGADIEWRLAEFKGGDARNAIPREASVLLGAPVAQLGQLKAAIEANAAIIRKEIQAAEPGFEVVVETAESPAMLIDWPSMQNLLDALRVVPDGALRFSYGQEGVVETSTNLGIIQIGQEGPGNLCHLLRSLVDSSKAELGAAMTGLYRLAGARARVFGDYPGWKPALESELLPVFKEACQKRLGVEPRILVVHGGLECGILRALNPALDCISYGPLIKNMHSPEECVSVESVTRFFAVLSDSLETLSRKQ